MGHSGRVGEDTSDKRLTGWQRLASRSLARHAVKALFPKAMIDKLIGDEVMALYLRPTCALVRWLANGGGSAAFRPKFACRFLGARVRSLVHKEGGGPTN
jgi:class 3 adenylate cyclase